MSTAQSHSGNGNGHSPPPPPPFDATDPDDLTALFHDVNRLKNRADTADLGYGAILRAIGDLSKLVQPIDGHFITLQREVNDLGGKVDAVIKDSRDNTARLRAAKGEIEALKLESSENRFRDKLDSQHDLENTGQRMKLEAGEAARLVAKEESKEAAEKVAASLRLERERENLATAKETLVEVKEINRHWGRWVADGGKYIFLVVVCAALVKYLVGGH